MPDLILAVIIGALAHAAMLSIWLCGIYSQLQRIARASEKGDRR